MVIVTIINTLIFAALVIIGIIHSIKQRKNFIQIIQLQLNKKTVVSFLIMTFFGGFFMFILFVLNIKLGLVKIISIDNLLLSLKQIPTEFITAAVEEFLLRVFVFIAIIKLTKNKLIALIGSSIIFCFLHSSADIINITSYFIAGLMYGIAFLKYNTIWASIGLHFSWNYFQGAIFGFPVSGQLSEGLFNLDIVGNAIWNGGETGLEGSLIGVITRIIIIISIVLTSTYFGNKKSSQFLIINKTSS